MKKITKDTYLSWYEDMLFWRKFEDKLAAVYIQQKVRGFLHLYNGQEAVLAGSLHAMDLSKDKMITAYRNHVQPIGMGVDPKKVMAELYGKATGTSQGLGGSMHIFSKEHRFYGGHGIVGGQIPLGAGIAFGDKYHGSDAATLCYFGDGAARQGSLHETFNLAMLWKLPVVFIIENNQYAMGTSIDRASSTLKLFSRGQAFNIPGQLVDGMDVLKVSKATELAAKNCRDGNGPFILEMNTYRYKGHSMSDPAKYRTREEVQNIKDKKDPIENFQKYLLKQGVKEDEFKNIDQKIKGTISEAAEFAIESEEPDLSDLFKDIYLQH